MRRMAGTVLVAALWAAGCSGNGEVDETQHTAETGSQTVETGSPKSFCQSAGELAAAMATDSWVPGVRVEQSFAGTFEALDYLANSAPAEIKGDAEGLRSALERFYSSLDDVPAVGTPPDPARQQQAQSALEATQAESDAVAPLRDRVSRFVEARCPGTTLFPVTVPPPPGS